MGAILNGKEVAMKVKNNIRMFVEKVKVEGKRVPTIASVLVGSDGGSVFYQNSQEKIARDLGVNYKKISLEEQISEEELLIVINRLNEDEEIDGIIIFCPLPKHLDENYIINSINPNKDIDCMTDVNIGKFYSGKPIFTACTPLSVLTILQHYNIELKGKNVVIVGRSNIVGKPAAQLLLNNDATVTICHSKTKNLRDICKKAEVLVVAIGKPHFINEEYVSPGTVVIDVGTSSVEGKIVGDVDFNSVEPLASYITPVPGGVGALTTTLLFNNLCEAWKLNDIKKSKCN